MGPSRRSCHHNLDGVLISEGDNDAVERSSCRKKGPKKIAQELPPVLLSLLFFYTIMNIQDF